MKRPSSVDGVIRLMISTVESWDPHTAAHQRRVANLSCLIAHQMSLSEEQVEGVKLAGSIHDFGKISIPVEVFNKPGRLNRAEFELVKTHPRISQEILCHIELPWPLLEIIFQHHERMDGSGYPSGLVGHEILVESRVLAVADVVEAMAAPRPHRPALGIKMALAEISENKESLYDLEVVEACQELFTGYFGSFEEARMEELFNYEQ